MGGEGKPAKLTLWLPVAPLRAEFSLPGSTRTREE